MNTKVKPAKSKIVWPQTEAAKKKKLEGALKQVSKNLPAIQTATALSALPVEHKDRFTAQIREEMKNGPLDTVEAEEQADKYLNENNAWDEVGGISIDCAQLLRSAALFTPALREPKLMAHVTDSQLLVRNVQSLTRDTHTMMKELEKIRKTHQGKTGGATTPEDLMLSCSVFTDYVNFMDRHNASLMPTSVWISEQIQVAIEKLRLEDEPLAKALYDQITGRMREISDAVNVLTGGNADGPTDAVIKSETVMV